MISYDLAKKLKEAGYPQNTNGYTWYIDQVIAFPNLSELIESCGEHFVEIKRIHNEHGIIWRANGNDTPSNAPDWGYSMAGSTPEEAVANLWLALNKNG